MRTGPTRIEATQKGRTCTTSPSKTKPGFTLVKTIVCILAVEMIAATAFTQGQVLFANRVANGWSTHIYGANPSSPGQSQQGNGSADIPSGTTDWSGFPLLDGSQGTFTAQLWAAPGANQPENSLVPVPTTTTVLSGRSAGFLYP